LYDAEDVPRNDYGLTANTFGGNCVFSGADLKSSLRTFASYFKKAEKDGSVGQSSDFIHPKTTVIMITIV